MSEKIKSTTPDQGRDSLPRCFGNGIGKEFYADYHDNEWGVPVHDDAQLFEMLVLEGAQAGLSWETILTRRDGYRKAFYNFDIEKVAKMSDSNLESLRGDSRIIRNKLKIYSARKNAQVVLSIIQDYGSFDKYLWGFVEGKPIKSHWKSFEDVPVTTRVSDQLSRDLKNRGMSFVGSTIIYAYMQAIGMVNDHLTTCWKYQP